MASVFLYVCSIFVIWSILCTCLVESRNPDGLHCPSVCDCLGPLIDCSKKGLTAIPNDVNFRSWATKLELQRNSISMVTEDDFRGLYSLEVLFISHNAISEINGSAFQDLTMLRALRISHNRLVRMPVFSPNLNITQLSLSHNMIHTVEIDALKSLPCLKVLYLDHNNIMDLPIRAFPLPSHLTHLHLSNNKVLRLNPGWLHDLHALEQLKLNKNKLFELKKDSLSQLKSLKFLDLSHNHISIIHGLAFSGLENLQVLRLRHNRIATLMDGAFWGLSSITNLQLDYNNISSVDSSWLFGLSTVKQLSLSHNGIQAVQQDDGGWKYCRGNLNKLDLTHNRLRTVYAGTFRKLVHLEELLLDHNELTRIDDGAFDDLRRLLTLEINDNSVSWAMGDFGGAFTGLDRLIKLGLEMNHIRSITKHAFSGLSRLEMLHLEDNDITTIQEYSFKPFHNLQELRMNSTNLLCDCHLSWLPGWLLAMDFRNSVVAVCSHPEQLRGKSIFGIAEEEFECNRQEVLQPVIRTNPASRDAYRGENVTLSCSAVITVDADLTVSWKKDNTVMDDSAVESYASVDSGGMKSYQSYIRLTDVHDRDAGHYQCVVQNRFGTAFSRHATVNVYVLPVFTKKPVDIAVRAGQAAKLQCSATGHPVPVIKWQKDSDDFPAARERRMYVLPDDDQFFIASTRAADSGVYTCLAENEAGVITADASVTILETPDFSKHMEQVKESRVGETSVLECLVSGSPPPELRWLKDSLPLEETVRHFLAADAQLLVIVDTVPPDAGTYTCEVTNAVGTRRGVTHLSVLPVGDQRTLQSDNAGGVGGNTSTTTATTIGIILIAAVCCVVGTSVVWVIVICQARRRHRLYGAAPTGAAAVLDESTTVCSWSGGGGNQFYDHITVSPYSGSLGSTPNHLRDCQLTVSGSPAHFPTTTLRWSAEHRTAAAIFPSDVVDDGASNTVADGVPPGVDHRWSAVDQHQHSRNDDRVDCRHDVSDVGADFVMSYEPVVLGIVAAPHSSAAPQCRSSLTTFHPDPTGHDRGCPSSVPTVRLAEDGSVTCLDTSLVRMRTPRLDNNQGGIAEPQLYGHLDTIRAPARGYSPRESSQLPIADSVTLCCDASPSCDADNNSQHSFLPAVCTPVITSALTVPWSPHDSLRCVDRPRPDMAADSRPMPVSSESAQCPVPAVTVSDRCLTSDSAADPDADRDTPSHLLLHRSNPAVTHHRGALHFGSTSRTVPRNATADVVPTVSERSGLN